MLVVNKVAFFGDESRIREIEKYVRSDEAVFDFHRILPMDASGDQSQEGLAKLWGAHSNALEGEIKKRDMGCLTYEFKTKWTPPYHVFCELRRLFRKDICPWYYASRGRKVVGIFNGIDSDKESRVFEALLPGYEQEMERLENSTTKMVKMMSLVNRNKENRPTPFESKAQVLGDSEPDVFWCHLPHFLSEHSSIVVDFIDGTESLDQIFEKFDQSEHVTGFLYKGDEYDRMSDAVVQLILEYLRNCVSEGTGYYAIEDHYHAIVIHVLNESQHTPAWGVHLYLYYPELHGDS